ncbi:uncharacterized protein si:ch211-195b21.5 isoform X2 [Lampris incognitus]|uniref:uncharacterized protein si:ch211-195b21.5 isoform X2 n=1 Tax=Lampris incognitus TaxID=2546036 RepID=UPI0024B488DF|nr:uncharacterized protein si:ch211-195b21.5 isoform X2 [Lampris incognitus]
MRFVVPSLHVREGVEEPSRWKTQPHCGNTSTDRSTVATVGSHQMLPTPDKQLPMPQWNTGFLECHAKDSSERAGEEFLRCIAANKPLPDYLKGNLVYNPPDTFKSANPSKPALSSNHKHRSRSRSRSRAKSYVRSKSRARSRSPPYSRGRSRSRAKSCGRAKSMARSRSRSRGKSRARSKSRVRSRSHSRGRDKAKQSRRGNSSNRLFSPNCTDSSKPSTSNRSLLEGLKLVMNSRELEDKLPTLKDAILTIQATHKGKDVKADNIPTEQEQGSSSNKQQNVLQVENDSIILPHDRVGNDFSWLQASSQEDSAAIQKTEDPDDEDSFLYGNGDIGEKLPVAAVLGQSGELVAPQHIHTESSISGSQQHLHKPMFSCPGDLLDLKQLLEKSPSSSLSIGTSNLEHKSNQELASCSIDIKECEKIKVILRNMGLNLGTTEVSKMMKVQELKQEKQWSPVQTTGSGTQPAPSVLVSPALGNTNVRQALESLQSLIKATKEKRVKNDPRGSTPPQNSSDIPKVGDNEESKRREKQARMKKIETLMKELEGLLKENGCDFMTPVIRFYCQKCDEFMGDLSTVESHAACHRHNDSGSQKHLEKSKEEKGQSHHHSSSKNSQPHPADRRDHGDSSYHRDAGDYKRGRDHHGDYRDEREKRHSDVKYKHDSEPRSHRDKQEKMPPRGEMMKERLLITVSRGLTPPPPPKMRAEESDKGLVIGRHRRFNQDDKGKPSAEDRDKSDREKDKSSDSSDEDKNGKSSKSKFPKKKDKKKKKKKKVKKEKGDRF